MRRSRRVAPLWLRRLRRRSRPVDRERKMPNTIIARLVSLGAALLLATVPLALHAQPPGKVARLGVLLVGTPATDPNLASFVAALRDLGYVPGRNVALEYRSAEGHPERV